MSSKRVYIGRKEENPFKTLGAMQKILDEAHPITRKSFCMNCEVSDLEKEAMQNTPGDFQWKRSGEVYILFITHHDGAVDILFYGVKRG